MDRTTVTRDKESFFFMVCKLLISGHQTSRSERWIVAAHVRRGQKISHNLEANTRQCWVGLGLSYVVALSSFGKGDEIVKLAGSQVE